MNFAVQWSLYRRGVSGIVKIDLTPSPPNFKTLVDVTTKSGQCNSQQWMTKQVDQHILGHKLILGKIASNWAIVSGSNLLCFAEKYPWNKSLAIWYHTIAGRHQHLLAGPVAMLTYEKETFLQIQVRQLLLRKGLFTCAGSRMKNAVCAKP